MKFGKVLAGSLAAVLGVSTGLAQTEEQSRSGLNLSAINKSVNPCQDFYAYACGNWVKNNPIPADQSSWGTFDQLHERNQKALREILENAEQHPNSSPIDQKIGGFYKSCMDEESINRRGAAPMQSELERLSHVDSTDELSEELIRLHAAQIQPFFVFDTTPDPTNARMNIAEVDQGGLGLPEKDYYLRTDAKSEEIRKQYVAHIGKMLELIGVAPEAATRSAASAMSIETALAKGSLDVTARRDPQLLLHKMTPSQLEQLAPKLQFARFFAQLQMSESAQLNVAVPQFFKAVNDVLATRSMDDLKAYVTWAYVNAAANRLSKPFVQENFEFYGKTLSGTTELRPRWKRCVGATDQALGEALGRRFVEKTFGEQGKARTMEMVSAIEHQMANDIETRDWMSPETKRQALIKLHAVANKIGYPDKWRDYSGLNVVAEDYFANWYRAQEFEGKRERDKIGKPVDRGEWEMTPPTVNAYYDPSQNNINFPAGILQPPFYSNQASDAVNFGAVGVVIGHELTHGFDDQGRQYDADGNLKDWWQKSDQTRFNKLADCFVNEYGGFSPVPGVELNGKLTLGENTADNGGLHLAYMALLEDFAKKSVPLSTKQDGFTEPQQFFLGFAQGFCENVRPEQARVWAQTDPHSPGKFRIDGTVSNMPEFGQAFGCHAGEKMEQARACRVW